MSFRYIIPPTPYHPYNCGSPTSSVSASTQYAHIDHSATATATATKAMPRQSGSDERVRLDALHRVHSLVLEPYHSGMVQGHLAKVHSTGRRSAVLDVGTGTGTWATQLANSQPFADVLGVDIEWTAFGPGHSEHGNVDFSGVDITHPLPWTRDHFDLIHVKGLLLDVPNYSRLVERVAMILRPGGLLVLVESEPEYRSANGGQPPACLRTWDACVRDAFSQEGIDVSLPSKLLSSVASSGVFSPSPYCQQLGLPLGGYLKGDSNALKKAGQIHSSILEANLRRVIPTLVEYGYRPADLETLLRSCVAELSRPDSRYFQRLFAVYATKNV